MSDWGLCELLVVNNLLLLISSKAEQRIKTIRRNNKLKKLLKVYNY